MRPFSKKLGALAVRELDVDVTDGPVCCEVEGCQRMALERVTMAGHPAGFVCIACARLWVRLWAELTTEVEPEDVVLAEAA